MNAKQIIRELLQVNDMTQKELAHACGMKGQGNISGFLNRCDTMRMDTYARLIDALGYKLMVVPKNTIDFPGWYEVDVDIPDQEKE